MSMSRLAWYLMFIVIVALVGLYGGGLALNLGLTATAVLILVGCVASVLMMTYIYLNG